MKEGTSIISFQVARDFFGVQYFIAKRARYKERWQEF
jgi:hypothetical protein